MRRSIPDPSAALVPHSGTYNGAFGDGFSLPQRHCHTIVCALAGVLLATAARAQDVANPTDSKPACTLEAVGTASVRRVIDGRTVVLADGRELKLAGIETPQVNAAGAQTARAQAAKSALEALIADRVLTLKRLGAGTDRYGRVVAHAFVAQASTPDIWLQQALVAQGHARVAAKVGDPGCATALLAAEKAARIARLGLWADPYYVMRRAEAPAEVLAERGHFTLVEGRVLSVRESSGTIYVNFGRRWSEDFTVTVARRSEKAFAAAGLELRKLAGRTVRVRGHVEERGGPWIEASAPEQIEIAE